MPDPAILSPYYFHREPGRVVRHLFTWAKTSHVLVLHFILRLISRQIGFLLTRALCCSLSQGSRNQFLHRPQVPRPSETKLDLRASLPPAQSRNFAERRVGFDTKAQIHVSAQLRTCLKLPPWPTPCSGQLSNKHRSINNEYKAETRSVCVDLDTSDPKSATVEVESQMTLLTETPHLILSALGLLLPPSQDREELSRNWDQLMPSPPLTSKITTLSEPDDTATVGAEWPRPLNCPPWSDSARQRGPWSEYACLGRWAVGGGCLGRWAVAEY